MATLTLTVYTTPIAQPRTKSGPNKKTGGVSHYVDDKHPVHAYKEELFRRAKELLNNEEFLWKKDGPFRVNLFFLLPCPRTIEKDVRQWVTRKPDKDNLEKACLDALKGTFFHDDCQVVCGSTIKQYAAQSEKPFVRITITHLEDYVRDD